MVEFVSYNGRYPNLCAGELVLRVDGEEVNFGKFCLESGGYVAFGDEWNEQVEKGPWSVNVPPQYAQYADEITEVVNANVPWGCCGGCI